MVLTAYTYSTYTASSLTMHVQISQCIISGILYSVRSCKGEPMVCEVMEGECGGARGVQPPD